MFYLKTIFLILYLILIFHNIVLKSIVNGVLGKQRNAMQHVDLMLSKDGQGKSSLPQCLLAATVLENTQKMKSAAYPHVQVSNIDN